jgi:hypothetical protein
MNMGTLIENIPPPAELSEILDSLRRIEVQLAEIRSTQTIRDWYSTEEVAKLLGKAEFTVREWCRLGRINAVKRQSGRGAHRAWVISNDELQRLQREGLLPLDLGDR